MAIAGAGTEAVSIAVPLLLIAWGAAGMSPLRGRIDDVLLRIVFAGVAVVFVRLAWRILQWEFERAVVTNEKVIHISGVVSRRVASTPLSKVSEFSVRQPPLGRLLNYGSLVVDVPGGREQALHGLSRLPDPAHVYRLVSSRSARRSESGPSAAAVGPPPSAPWDQDATTIIRVVPPPSPPEVWKDDDLQGFS
jgi:hypothetical protein